jgi:hypothetical protein
MSIDKTYGFTEKQAELLRENAVNVLIEKSPEKPELALEAIKILMKYDDKIEERRKARDNSNNVIAWQEELRVGLIEYNEYQRRVNMLPAPEPWMMYGSNVNKLKREYHASKIFGTYNPDNETVGFNAIDIEDDCMHLYNQLMRKYFDGDDDGEPSVPYVHSDLVWENGVMDVRKTVARYKTRRMQELPQELSWLTHVRSLIEQVNQQFHENVLLRPSAGGVIEHLAIIFNVVGAKNLLLLVELGADPIDVAGMFGLKVSDLVRVFMYDSEIKANAIELLQKNTTVNQIAKMLEVSASTEITDKEREQLQMSMSNRSNYLAAPTTPQEKLLVHKFISQDRELKLGNHEKRLIESESSSSGASNWQQVVPVVKSNNPASIED